MSNATKSMRERISELREGIADHLVEYTNLWTVVGVIILVILYIIRKSFGSQTQSELIGDIVLFVFAGIGFTSGLLALGMIGFLKVADFNKLEKFQGYLILGVGVSTAATAIIVLHALGVLPFVPPKV